MQKLQRLQCKRSLNRENTNTHKKRSAGKAGRFLQMDSYSTHAQGTNRPNPYRRMRERQRKRTILRQGGSTHPVLIIYDTRHNLSILNVPELNKCFRNVTCGVNPASDGCAKGIPGLHRSESEQGPSSRGQRTPARSRGRGSLWQRKRTVCRSGPKKVNSFLQFTWEVRKYPFAYADLLRHQNNYYLASYEYHACFQNLLGTNLNLLNDRGLVLYNNI